MSESDVRQLVCHHCSELRLIVRSFDRAAIYEHITGGQRECIDGLVIHAMKFEWILHSASRQLLHQTGPKLCQISIHPWSIAERQLLLSVRGRPLAKAYIFLWRKLVPSWLERRALRTCIGSCNKKCEQQESRRNCRRRSAGQERSADFPLNRPRFCPLDTHYALQIAPRSRMALLDSRLL